jgi:hypothetical protein
LTNQTRRRQNIVRASVQFWQGLFMDDDQIYKILTESILIGGKTYQAGSRAKFMKTHPSGEEEVHFLHDISSVRVHSRLLEDWQQMLRDSIEIGGKIYQAGSRAEFIRLLPSGDYEVRFLEDELSKPVPVNRRNLTIWKLPPKPKPPPPPPPKRK